MFYTLGLSNWVLTTLSTMSLVRAYNFGNKIDEEFSLGGKEFIFRLEKSIRDSRTKPFISLVAH